MSNTTTISTRSNNSIKPLRGKENYITWSIEIENVLLRNNNAAYIRNGSRAARPPTRYLNKYNRQLDQYDLDLEAYNAAAAAFEAAGRRGRGPMRPALPRKLDEAKGEEKELKTQEEKQANALIDVIESIHYTLQPSIQNHQSTIEELLDYCKTLYSSIGQNECMRAYLNLNSIRLSSCKSLQQYIICFNNAYEELTCIGATLPYRLILFQLIKFIDNDEYRFQKESFKTKIRELSDENLEQGNQIQQAQQELLDRNIDPIREGNSLKHQCEDSIGEVNLTRNNLNRNKQSKSANSDSSRVSTKSTRNKPSVSKCDICDGNYTTEKCYYTSKNPLSGQSSKPEIQQKIIETYSKQD